VRFALAVIAARHQKIQPHITHILGVLGGTDRVDRHQGVDKHWAGQVHNAAAIPHAEGLHIQLRHIGCIASANGGEVAEAVFLEIKQPIAQLLDKLDFPISRPAVDIDYVSLRSAVVVVAKRTRVR
jgi:hypothetical protein